MPISSKGWTRKTAILVSLDGERSPMPSYCRRAHAALVRLPVKSTAGPVTLARPKVCGTTEWFASQMFGHMWPTNAAAGAGYGAALRTYAAALLPLSPPAISGASPAAGTAAAGLAENVAVNAVGAAMRAAEQGATAVLSPAEAAVDPIPSSSAMLLIEPLSPQGWGRR